MFGLRPEEISECCPSWQLYQNFQKGTLTKSRHCSHHVQVQGTLIGCLGVEEVLIWDFFKSGQVQKGKATENYQSDRNI